MSRKDNIFPKYVKLKIDPKNPPHDLWDRGARKCGKCGTNWPNYAIFDPSPCCDNHTSAVEGAPELPWTEAVKKLLFARFERYYDKWNEDVTDEAILWDRSIEIPSFTIDEEEFQKGLQEIDRLIGEPSKSSTEL